MIAACLLFAVIVSFVDLPVLRNTATNCFITLNTLTDTLAGTNTTTNIEPDYSQCFKHLRQILETIHCSVIVLAFLLSKLHQFWQ